MASEITTSQPAAAQPTLPSAKPARSIAISLMAASAVMLLIGLGLGSTATRIYVARTDRRLAKSEQLTALSDSAEIRQQRAQLQRSYDAPIWVNNQSYDPRTTYQVSGIRKIEVPVLVGIELDTAVCVGTMGPEGFIQNPDAPLCLSY